MARGKYGEKAARRQAELAVSTDLASYQHRVAQLTAENRELRERLAAQERTAKQAERRLRAERDEGVAPQVEALSLQLRSALAQRDEADRAAKVARDRLSTVSNRMLDHLTGEHRLSREAAMETLLSWAGQGPTPSLVVRGSGRTATIEGQRRIDAARGLKHLPAAGTLPDSTS